MAALTDLEIDGITEVFNIGIGKAASSLSQIVNEEVSLTVPKLNLVSPSEAVRLLEVQPGQSFNIVKESFTGPLWGDALLIFPETGAVALTRALLGDTHCVDGLSDMDKDAVTEVGNIILNGCISSIADLFHIEISIRTLEYHHGSLDPIMGSDSGLCDQNDDSMLMLRIEFQIEKQSVRGFMVFGMNVAALSSFTNHLRQAFGKLEHA